jgi:hypothetical protein
MRASHWVAGCALASFLVGVPLLHIAGPNYHHPVPVRVVVTQRAAPDNDNPYLPLQAPQVASKAPGKAPSATSGSGHGRVSPYMLWRMARRAHPRLRGLRLSRRNR